MKIRKWALAWALQAALLGTTVALAVSSPAEAACPTSEPDCERGTWSGGTTTSGTTVTGVFRYNDIDDAGTPFLRAISGAKVEIWRYRLGWYGWGWIHDATTELRAVLDRAGPGRRADPEDRFHERHGRRLRLRLHRRLPEPALQAGRDGRARCHLRQPPPGGHRPLAAREHPAR